MGRPARLALGGYAYHALNRANARMRIFDTDDDYDAFEVLLEEACRRLPMRVLAYCVMPNHWHLVLRPHHDGDLSAFLGWLTLTHTQRWHAHHGTTGSGHVYQGRFRSFVIQNDEHLLTVCRYVERNALRGGLVTRAEAWRWCSLWRRRFGDVEARALLASWPVEEPRNWVTLVNRPQSDGELAALRRSVNRGRPFGSDYWIARTVNRFDLASTMRRPGRPCRSSPENGS